MGLPVQDTADANLERMWPARASSRLCSSWCELGKFWGKVAALVGTPQVSYRGISHRSVP